MKIAVAALTGSSVALQTPTSGNLILFFKTIILFQFNSLFEPLFMHKSSAKGNSKRRLQRELQMGTSKENRSRRWKADEDEKFQASAMPNLYENLIWKPAKISVNGCSGEAVIRRFQSPKFSAWSHQFNAFYRLLVKFLQCCRLRSVMICSSCSQREIHACDLQKRRPQRRDLKESSRELGSRQEFRPAFTGESG